MKALIKFSPQRTRRPIIVVMVIFLLAVVADCTKKPAEVWYCPMHTHYRSDHPGNCPICGMALVKEENPQPQKAEARSGAEAKAAVESKPPEAHAITIAPEKQQLLGLTTSRPQERKLTLKLKLAGQVAYEPDIYAAIIEYRQLAAAAHSLDGSVGGGAGLTQSALLRLRQLGLGSDEIGQYARSEAAASRLVTGYGAGKALITLRLSEADLSFMRKGLPVTITASAFPGKTWKGQVTGIGSLVDAKNRSLSARVLVSDNGQLRAQMAVNAELDIKAGSGVSVERAAIFDTGERQLVFVKISPTEFSPRAVRVLGGNDDYALVSGITAKDEVVTSSAFLLDSEAKLRLGDAVSAPPSGFGHAH